MRSRFLTLPLLAAAIGAHAQTQTCGTSGVRLCSPSSHEESSHLDLQAMCVSAVVQSNSTTQYTLTVKQAQVGWMAMLVSITLARLLVTHPSPTVALARR